MMAKYPVRCCFEPTKLYGYLELPAGLRSGHETSVSEVVRMAMMPVRSRDSKPTVSSGPTRHRIKLMRVVDPRTDLDEVAVYSDDRPIEFWRKIVGFQELKPHRITFHTIDLGFADYCRSLQGSSDELTLSEDIFGRPVAGKVVGIKFDEHPRLD